MVTYDPGEALRTSKRMWASESPREVRATRTGTRVCFLGAPRGVPIAPLGQNTRGPCPEESNTHLISCNRTVLDNANGVVVIVVSAMVSELYKIHFSDLVCGRGNVIRRLC